MTNRNRDTTRFAPLCMLALLVGCGGDSGPDVDASTPDATGLDAGSSGVVTVRVLDDGVGVGGADVVIGNPDGSLKEHRVTDGSGELVASIVGGDVVTAIRTDIGRRITWVAVQPGDELDFALSPPRVGSLSVSLPGDVPGATLYSVSAGGCFDTAPGASAPVIIALRPNCLSPDGTTTVVAVARSGGEPVAITSQGNISIAAGTTAVQLAPFDSASLEKWTVNPSNVPVDRRVAGVVGGFSANGLKTTLPTQFDGSTATVSRAGSIADLSWAAVDVLGPDASGVLNFAQLHRQVGPDVESLPFDLATLLPSVAAMDRDGSDPNRPIYTLTYVGQPAGADVVVHTFLGTVDGDPFGLEWTVVAPGSSAATAQVPEVPGPLQHPIDALNTALVGNSQWSSYDEARTAVRGLEPTSALLDPTRVGELRIHTAGAASAAFRSR